MLGTSHLGAAAANAVQAAVHSLALASALQQGARELGVYAASQALETAAHAGKASFQSRAAGG